MEFKLHKLQRVKIALSLRYYQLNKSSNSFVRSLLMMNIHAHLTTLEVIGILGGQVVSEGGK